MRHFGATRHDDAPPKMFVGRQDGFLMGCGSKVIRVGAQLDGCDGVSESQTPFWRVALCLWELHGES